MLEYDCWHLGFLGNSVEVFHSKLQLKSLIALLIDWHVYSFDFLRLSVVDMYFNKSEWFYFLVAFFEGQNNDKHRKNWKISLKILFLYRISPRCWVNY